jgi:tetraacyldisaccharide 4'-kinase
MNLTSLVSAIWSFFSAMARAASQKGWLRSEPLGCRTWSVGNIQVGGAGKTPLVALVARQAVSRGLSVAVLTRGYGGIWEQQGGVIEPRSKSPHPQFCGDEPALLHELVPDAWIVIGRDRVRQYRRVERKRGRGFDLVILDDGFQHWRIRKDLELVALTSHTSETRLHRDSISALRHADLLIWTKGETRPALGFEAPLVRLRSRARQIHGNSASGGRLWLLTGVADGAAVRADIEALGHKVIHHSVFPDHARFADALAFELRRQALEAGCSLAMTGKDWVKWKTLAVDGLDEVRVFEPELTFQEGESEWHKKLWGE